VDLAGGDHVDRYVLVQQLGEGGQGSVWKAEDKLEPGRPRALKLVPLVLARPNDVERVRREARALAKLEHPSLVRCHALFEDLQRSLLGIVMDFVDGAALREAAGDAWMTDRHRTLALRHVANALAYVHAQNVVHRDLKLENVLVTRAFWDEPELASNVKLVDFGIAKTSDGAHALTAVDSLIGTISYLSPEILDPAFFDESRDLPAADVFAFGVMAYRLLLEGHPTGLPPRAGIVDYGAAYRAAAKSDVPWPPDVPKNAWGDLLRACLRVRASERIKDGAALAERCALAGDWSTVVRPSVDDAERRSGPTSVASPGAMRDDTASAARPSADADRRRAIAALAPTESIGPGTVSSTSSPQIIEKPPPDPEPARPATRPQPVVARARALEASIDAPRPTLRATEISHPPADDRSSRAPLVFGAVLVAALGGGFAYWSASRANGTPAPLVPPSASSSLGTGALATAPGASVVAEVPDAAEAAVTPPPATWPSDCSAIDGLCACCPSGRDCSPGRCDELLNPDEDFHLRLGQVIAKGRDLVETSPDFSLCTKPADQPPEKAVCTRIGDTAGGRIPDQKLYVNGRDLRTGIEIELRAAGDAGDVIARATLSGKLKREVLCKGAVLAELVEAGDVERIVLFLDSANSVATLRCPSDR
jgi:eukaryotic-like serine/threonine-protein kinase